MKSIVLYGSPVKLTNAHKLVSGNYQTPYYVRMKCVVGDTIHALDKAKPMPGETVLNSVEDQSAQPQPEAR